MKPNQSLWRISIATTLEAEDAVTEFAGTLLGQPASAYFNVETSVSVVSVYFSDRKLWSRSLRGRLATGLQTIQECGVTVKPGEIRFAKVKREDWAESWKKHFHPMEIADSLLIKPSWSKKRPRRNQAVVVLDPGLSFGTGQHATTSFCLAEVVRCRRPNSPQAMLDIGTGSGILAIAAAKLGYRTVHAFDFDPEAVRIAKANAGVNDLEKRIRITRGDVTKLPTRVSKQYDLVCANLISNLLVAERKRLVQRLAPGGTLVLAGILAAEFSTVQTAFEACGLHLVASRSEKEWRSGSFQYFKKL